MERVRTFVWVVMKDSLLTNVKRHRRGMTTTKDCARCGEEESASHIFKECIFAQECWCVTTCHRSFQLTSISPCIDLVKRNCKLNDKLADATC